MNEVVYKMYSATCIGPDPVPVTIEVSVSVGVGIFLVGLPDSAVRESLLRVTTALAFCGFKIPGKKTVINMAPANLKKEGSGYDVAIASALLAASGQALFIAPSDFILLGELSLSGELRKVPGVLPIAIKAAEMGFSQIICPKECAMEAAGISGVEVYGVSNLREVIKVLQRSEGFTEFLASSTQIDFTPNRKFECDFANVKGQIFARRGLEIAASGGHNLMMSGPPGAGKSFMAKAFASIIPPMTMEESLQTSIIYSVAGLIGPEGTLVRQRPFRTPHHTASVVGLAGGTSKAMPGEVSLAHNGVLFLDELTEFNRATLEILRQPLEDRKITITRANYTVEYPCSFMLVASMNPCPCGYYGDPLHKCNCTPGQISRYLSKISGPLLDRIDIHCEIQAVPFSELSKMKPGEPSTSHRQRVIKARLIQEERFKDYKNVHCNAQMTERMLHMYAEPDDASLEILRMAMEKLSLSARAYSRILKVARTIADLEGSEKVQSQHIAEAIGYRNLDRGDWAERGL